jgi:hypothetical protein
MSDDSLLASVAYRIIPSYSYYFSKAKGYRAEEAGIITP